MSHEEKKDPPVELPGRKDPGKGIPIKDPDAVEPGEDNPTNPQRDDPQPPGNPAS